MSALQLEVGKTYVTHAFYPDRNFNFVVKIMGIVDTRSIEYDDGGRFFANNKAIYTDQGYLLVDDSPCDPLDEFNIKEEANLDDLDVNLVDRMWIEIDRCRDNKYYLCLESSSIELTVGKIYVDRMGFFHFINAQRYDQYSGQQVFYSSPDTVFDSKGNACLGEGVSMADLVYQRI